MMTVNILLRDRRKKKHKWNYTKRSRAMYDVESFQIKYILEADNMLHGDNLQKRSEKGFLIGNFYAFL
jgi:hypothetical protein